MLNCFEFISHSHLTQVLLERTDSKSGQSATCVAQQALRHRLKLGHHGNCCVAGDQVNSHTSPSYIANLRGKAEVTLDGAARSENAPVD